MIPLAMIGSAVIGIILLLFANRKIHNCPYILVLELKNEKTEEAVLQILKQSAEHYIVKSKTFCRGIIKHIRPILFVHHKIDAEDFFREKTEEAVLQILKQSAEHYIVKSKTINAAGMELTAELRRAWTYIPSLCPNRRGSLKSFLQK